MTQEEFEAKWHLKVVKPLGHYQIPDKEYFVTAALYKHEGEETIFAIKAKDYNFENKHWFTIRLSLEEVEELPSRFAIIKDGV